MSHKLLSASRQRASDSPDQAPAAEQQGEDAAAEDLAADGDADATSAAAEDDEPIDEPDGDEDGDDTDEDGDGKPQAKSGTRRQIQLAERERIAAILTCADAKGREASALHMATATDMTAQDAQALLATMPKGAVSGALAQTMAKTPAPQVGPDGGAPSASGAMPGAEDPAARIVATYCAATGKPPRQK